jgi:diguanylate cyclase (GGDEF)-like protein
MLERLGARLSLQWRLFLPALVIAVPLFILQIADALSFRAHAIEAARTHMADLAALAAYQEGDALDEAGPLLQALSHVPEVRLAVSDAKPAGCQPLLRHVLEDHPLVTGLLVTGRDGRVACSSIESLTPSLSFADRSWFKQASAAAPHTLTVSEMLVSRASGKLTVVIAMPLPPEAPDETSPGVIAAGLDLGWFTAISASIASTTNAVVDVVDLRNGAVLARSLDPEHWVGKYLPDHPTVAAFRHAGSGVVEAPGFDGIARIYGIAPLPLIPSSQVVVAIGLPRAPLLAEANARLMRGIGIALAVTLAALASAWALARHSLLKPIRSLASVARRLGNGDLASRVHLARSNPPEIRALAHALNGAAEKLESREQQLARLAYHDGLTGLANRRSFELLLEKEWRRAARLGLPLALALIDVDAFKKFNDSYGHPAGDECLRQVSQAIEAVLRRPGDLAARYGGEEFAVILPGTDRAGALHMAERMLSAVRTLGIRHAASPSGRVTISIGIASVRPGKSSDSVQTFVEAVDAALYEAKRSGRNCLRLAPTQVPTRDGVEGFSSD